MINISTLLQQMLNGISFGILMALLATGLSLIFGMLGIINFAHGSLYMLAAYFVWTFSNLFNIPGRFWLGLIITLPTMAIVGFIIEKGLFRKMYDKPPVYQLLITFGILLVIQQGVALIYGTMPLHLEVPGFLSGEINLGLFHYPSYRFFAALLGMFIVLGVWLLIERSYLGAIIRACAEDPETARTLGISTTAVFTWTYVLGTVLAGLGGGLHAPMVPSLQHTMGMEILLINFIVVVIGGMGSIRGALLGGVILGMVRAIASVLWAPASDFVMFVAMGIILIVRPQGLLGKGGA